MWKKVLKRITKLTRKLLSFDGYYNGLVGREDKMNKDNYVISNLKHLKNYRKL